MRASTPDPVNDGESLPIDHFGRDVQVGADVEGYARRDRLDDRRQFEALLLDLTSRFINLPVHQIDQQIEQGLQILGTFLGIDRCTLAEFTENKCSLLVKHSYVGPGIEPFPKVVVDGQLPWYAEQIRSGSIIRLRRLPDDFPPEAKAERAYSIKHGLKSNLTIPLIVGETVNCVLAFSTFHDYRAWPDELVQRLWLVGEVFANSLARKRSEERTQHLREQLARMARITLVGELAAAIAHEVNQPLCAIVSNAQAGQRMLTGDHADVDEVRETLQDIAADSRRASEVVTRVRAMLQKQAPERAPLQLTAAIQEVVNLIYTPAMQKGVSISLHLPPDLPLVLGDRVQLQQVVLNLALNALDAMNHPEIELRQLSIHAARDGIEGVILSVCDTGLGVDSDDLDEVFQAFFTTKPTGLGVGLAISRSIVESHGGRIWAESKPGGGAAFHVSLPTATERRP